jgi:hypothetical protein
MVDFIFGGTVSGYIVDFWFSLGFRVQGLGSRV